MKSYTENIKAYHQKWCKVHRKERAKSQREWKRRNPQRAKEFRTAWINKKRAWFQAFKKSLKCSVCGENHPACLDFHHGNPMEKERGVSQIVQDASKKKILIEMAKCNVLCANCHRKLHYEEKINKNNV